MRFFIRSGGFTLLEILIAIVILSISLLALAALMATTTQNNSFGGHMTEAATFAQDQLEQLMAAPWANIVDGENTITGSIIGIVYTRNWVVVTNAEDNLKTVTITISWTDPVARSISFTTFIYKE